MDWAEIRDVHGVASEGGRQVLGWALCDSCPAVDRLYRLVRRAGPWPTSR